MALIACKECKNQISDKSKTCTSCGAPVPQGTSRLAILFAGIVLIVVLKTIFTDSAPRPTAQAAPNQKTEQQIKEEADFQFAVMGTKLLRASMKNPKSFELVSAGLVENGAVCVTYRGTNSFGATITEQKAINRKFEPANWNRDCVRKGGVQDVSSLRHAID